MPRLDEDSLSEEEDNFSDEDDIDFGED